MTSAIRVCADADFMDSLVSWIENDILQRISAASRYLTRVSRSVHHSNFGCLSKLDKQASNSNKCQCTMLGRSVVQNETRALPANAVDSSFSFFLLFCSKQKYLREKCLCRNSLHLHLFVIMRVCCCRCCRCCLLFSSFSVCLLCIFTVKM